MFKNLFKQHGAKNVVTLFHKPSNAASARVLTLLKQAHGQGAATATEDQASSHPMPEKIEFDLDVTEAPPTGDQLKNILEYLGGSGAVSQVIRGANNETDALQRLKADGESFERPLVVDWNQGKAVTGDNESAILSLLRSIPHDAKKS